MRFYLSVVVLTLALAASISQAFAACQPRRDADGRIHRSAIAVSQFKQANPCPATGTTTGKCPGYVVDHIVPLCACGADAPSNMQWQSRREAAIKDTAEKTQCTR